jgi:chromosomal replication initiator protein
MSTLQKEPDDMVVVGKIKEVLEQRIGSDRFGLWFGTRVEFRYHCDELRVVVDGDFALQRLRGNYLRAIESAAAEVLNRSVAVRLMLQADDNVMLATGGEVTTSAGPMLARTEDLADQADFTGRNGDDQPIKTLSVGSFPPPCDVVSGDGDDVSPGDSLIPRSPVATSGNRAARRTGATENRGPAPVGQWLMAAATNPSHSRRQPTTSSNTNIRPSMPSASDPNDAKLATQAAPATAGGRTSDGRSMPAGRPSAGNRTSGPRAGMKSIRVTSEHDSGGSKNGVCVTGSTANNAKAAGPANLTRTADTMTFGNFATNTSNTLAVTAAKMLAANPSNAAPLCFWGATGTGKTHLLSAIRHELRARHQMSRVLLMSAEDFTNDFLSCVRGTGLPAFRKRYRDVDALLVDNVQFLSGKNATLREMLYTVDTVLSRRRPLILAADRQPLEIDGLTADLAGRMSSGLVCGINPMELELRRDLFRRYATQSYMPWDDETIEMLAQRAVGDGRVIQGISQLVSMLQRMYRRMPTAQEITSHAGDLLQRGPKVVALADVEKAICTAFGLSTGELRSDSKSRNVSQPRILAMYLSRQHTTAAFSEIGRYYGDRNHSTVIAAHRRVEDWIKSDQSVGGRGPKNMKVHEAIAAVENLLRIG